MDQNSFDKTASGFASWKNKLFWKYYALAYIISFY